jgi:outer membrane protein insertion porin family
MVGVGINSDAGVTGQITIDERNSDVQRRADQLRGCLERHGVARSRPRAFGSEAMPGSQATTVFARVSPSRILFGYSPV